MIGKRLSGKKPTPLMIRETVEEDTEKIAQKEQISSKTGGKPLVESPHEDVPKEISGDLQSNIDWVKATFTKCSDLVCKELNIGLHDQRKAALFFIDGMIDKSLVNDHVIKPLAVETRMADPERIDDYYEWMRRSCLTSVEVAEAKNLTDGIAAFLSGDVLLLVEGEVKAFVIGARGWPNRGVGEPKIENTIRGPQEAFTETLRINTSLLRRRIKSNKLKIESREIGTLTKTNVAIVYLDGVASDKIINEVNYRLDQIKEVDSLLESGCIEQYLEDNPLSPFPQMQYTERPDKVVGNLLEGRIAIIIDGTPDVLIVPAVFIQFIQSTEDYYNRPFIATFQRWIRFFGMFVSFTLPALYIAISTYHPEMLPTTLVLSIAAAREGVPFPALVEAGIMTLALELLQEASLRMPGKIAGTLGVVGGLIIGQAAVEAKLAAPQMIIVVAITAIGSFVIPSYNAEAPIRLLRFPLMISGAVLGIYGITIFWIVILIHLIHLKSFGVPYLEPLAPFKVSGLKDTIIRGPRWDMMTEPLARQATEAAPHSFWKRKFMDIKGKGQKKK